MMSALPSKADGLRRREAKIAHVAVVRARMGIDHIADIA